MELKPICISLGAGGFCACCGSSGKIKAKRKAMQFNGPPIDYDEISIPCPFCGGSGFIGSTGSAPSSRRTE